MPNLFVIAGPNGAGKSTSAPELLTGPRRVEQFVNADVIASERGVSDIEAGRITLQRLTELAEARRDMAFETTLSSRLLLPRIRSMQAAGYLFHLFFFWLPNADMAVKRVAFRVTGGGHNIPEDALSVEDNDLWNQLVTRYVKPRVEQEQAIAAPQKLWTAEDIVEAVNRAVTAALKRHKELGQSIVVWRDGQVVTLKPEEIEV